MFVCLSVLRLPAQNKHLFTLTTCSAQQTARWVFGQPIPTKTPWYHRVGFGFDKSPVPWFDIQRAILRRICSRFYPLVLTRCCCCCCCCCCLQGGSGSWSESPNFSPTPEQSASSNRLVQVTDLWRHSGRVHQNEANNLCSLWNTWW